jgi:hypothetical protein
LARPANPMRMAADIGAVPSAGKHFPANDCIS